MTTAPESLDTAVGSHDASRSDRADAEAEAAESLETGAHAFWCRELLTDEGQVLNARPIEVRDFDALANFHQRLSTAIDYRFLDLRLHSAPTTVSSFALVDFHERMAFVVDDGETLVGVGSYAALNGPFVIEISIVVADDYQRHGVGTVLLSLLAEYAHAEGYRRLVAQFSADNEAMRETFVKSPFLTEFRRHRGVIDVQLDLQVDAVR